jgi:hypothetical protein
MSVNVLRRAAAPAVIGLLALAPSAFAAAGDTAHGTGAESFPGGFSRAFEFDAATTDSGTTGHMTLREIQADGTTDTIGAQVVCLSVSGGNAQVVGRIDESALNDGSAGSIGTALVFDVADKAAPGAGQDLFSAAYTGALPSDTCGSPAADVQIDSGEITVGHVSAPPADPNPPTDPPPPPPPPPAGSKSCAAGVARLKPAGDVAFSVVRNRRGRLRGWLGFESKGNVLTSTAISGFDVAGADATIRGTARVKHGKKVTFVATVHDGGRRGRGDSFSIAWQGFSTAGTLKNGDLAVCAAGGGAT